MKSFDNTRFNPTMEEIRFLRYRREVVLEMPEGEERHDLLKAIDGRMYRLEHQPKAA